MPEVGIETRSALPSRKHGKEEELTHLLAPCSFLASLALHKKHLPASVVFFGWWYKR